MSRPIIIVKQGEGQCCPPKFRKSRCPVRICDRDKDTYLTAEPLPDADFLQGVSANGFVLLYDVSKPNGTVPISGPGSRLLYHSYKSAFRTGKVTGDQWDDYNIGFNSASFGTNTIASGDSSFSSGYSTQEGRIEASGIASNVFGNIKDKGQILCDAPGGFVVASILNDGKIICSGDGTVIFGGAADNGEIITIGDGNMIHGYANGGKITYTMSPDNFMYASLINGYTVDPDNIGSLIDSKRSAAFTNGIAQFGAQIVNNSFGSICGGTCDGLGSKIEAGTTLLSAGNSITYGRVFSNSQILNYGIASFLHGYSSNEAKISIGELNFTTAAMAQGYTFRGTIIVNGNGSQGFGYVSSNSEINSNGACSYARGMVFTGSKLNSLNSSSHAEGFCVLSSEISATNVASYADGYSINSSSILSSGVASFGRGYVSSSEKIISSGTASYAHGRHLTNANNYSELFGKYGIAKASSTSGNDTIQGEGSLQIAGGLNNNVTDGISVIIGTSIFANNPIGGGIADFWHTTGADYAEMFEWLDGNTDNEDRIGYFVENVYDEKEKHCEKIQIAKNSDDVIGVVSSKHGTAGIIGDTAEKCWKGTHNKDAFGRINSQLDYIQSLKTILYSHHIDINNDAISEVLALNNNDVKTHLIAMIHADKLTLHPEIIKAKLAEAKEKNENSRTKADVDIVKEIEIKIDKEKLAADIAKCEPIRVAIANEKYDSEKKYIPRLQRREWDPIGLLGKLYVRDNGQCIPGHKCDCKDGIAIPGHKWKVLSRVDNSVIRILYK